MPAFTARENYSRKSGRITKYGKYRKPAGAGSRYAYGKGRGRGTRKIMVPKFLNPFSKDHELVQLKYTQNVILNPEPNALGSGNRWSFSFNSLFDPDITGTGNQPTYFDNYSQMYARYKVSFAKMKVTVVNHQVNTAVWNGTAVTSQPNFSYKLAIVRDANTSDFPNNMDSLLQQDAANCKWRYVAPQLNGKLPTLSIKCAPHKTAGVAYDDDTLQSATNSNPSRNIAGSIFITSADGQTDPPSVSLFVEITYFTKFFDRIVNQPTN